MQPPSSSPLHHVVLNSNNNTTAHHHQHLNNSNMLLNFAYQSSSSLTQQQSSSTPDHGLSSSNYHQVQQFSSEPSSSQISHYSNNHNYQPNNNNHHTYISMSHDQNFQNINTNHIQPHAQPSPSVMSMIENVPSSTTHNLIKNEPFSTSSSTENFYYNNHSSTMSNPMVDKNEQHAGLFDSLFHNSHQQNTHHYQGNSDPNTNLGLHNFNIHQTNVDVNSGMNNTIVGTSSYATANNTASLATILMNQTSQQQGFTNHSLGYSQISSQNNLSNMNNNTCGMVDLLNSEGTTVTPNISNSTLYTNHNMIGVTNNSQPGTMDQTFMNQQTGCYQQNQPFHFHNNVQNNSSTTDSYSQQGLTSQYQALQTPQPPQMPSSSFTRPSTTHDAALLDDEDLQEKPKKKNSKKKASKSANSPRSSTSSSPSASPTMVRKHRKNIAFEDIAACFEMPIRDASQMLGVSLTQLKRLCREFKIPRWPYRRLNSIQRRIEVLQIMQQRSETKNDEKSVQQTQMEIDKLQQEIIELKTNPSPNLISTLLNDGTLMTSGSVPSSSTEDSGTPSSLNDQFSFPTQDITRSPYNSFNSNNNITGIQSVQTGAVTSYNNIPSNLVASSSSYNPNSTIPINNNNTLTFQNYDPHTNNFTIANNNSSTMNMNSGNSALTNQQGGSCSFAQNSTATPFINNPNLGNNGNTSMTNSSSKATQHTSFHDYSHHFQSKAENPSPKIFFHNITFPVNSSTNYTVTNNGRNNNLQGSSQLNSMNVNNIGMSSNSVTVSTTDNLNSLNADSSSQITPSIPHQVSIQEQIFNSTNIHGAAVLDSLSDYEKMQLLALLVQCNNNNLGGMTNTNSDLGGNNHNIESKKDLSDVLNAIRKASTSSQEMSTDTHQQFVDNNMNMMDLSQLSQEEVMKLKLSLQDMINNNNVQTTNNPSQNK